MNIESVAPKTIYDFASACVQRRMIGVHISMHKEDGMAVNLFLEREEAERLLAALGRSVDVLRSIHNSADKRGT